MLAIVAAYLTFVGVGTFVMKRLPGDGFRFYGLSFVYNIVQVMLCSYMCIESLVIALRQGYTLTPCNTFDVVGAPVAKVLWLFYVSKLYEFFDTFIMIAKGSYRQVSVLHVYHHGSIAFIWWAIVYRAPGGDAYFSAAMNRSVCGEAPEHCARVWVRFVRIFAKPPTAVQHQRRVRIHRPRTITKMTSIYPTPRIWGLLNLFRGLLCLTAPRDPPNTLVTYLTQRVRPCPLPPNDPAPAGCTL